MARDLDLDLGSGVHHSSTSTYMPNFIEETFCGRTNGRTDIYLRPTLLRRLRRVDLKMQRDKLNTALSQSLSSLTENHGTETKL